MRGAESQRDPTALAVAQHPDAVRVHSRGRLQGLHRGCRVVGEIVDRCRGPRTAGAADVAFVIGQNGDPAGVEGRGQPIEQPAVVSIGRARSTAQHHTGSGSVGGEAEGSGESRVRAAEGHLTVHDISITHPDDADDHGPPGR